MIEPGDVEKVAQHNPSWLALWKHSEPKLPPGLEVEAVRCPHWGTPYKDVPGYQQGYGCPVCKGVGQSHLHVVAIAPDVLQQAYNEAWWAGHHQGRQDGITECSADY